MKIRIISISSNIKKLADNFANLGFLFAHPSASPAKGNITKAQTEMRKIICTSPPCSKACDALARGFSDPYP
jgi:hypothetical protein